MCWNINSLTGSVFMQKSYRFLELQIGKCFILRTKNQIARCGLCLMFGCSIICDKLHFFYFCKRKKTVTLYFRVIKYISVAEDKNKGSLIFGYILTLYCTNYFGKTLVVFRIVDVTHLTIN